MKIFFDNVNLSSRNGPNTFALRLAEALTSRGKCELVGASDNYDIMLAFIEPTRLPRKNSALVQRLDGIWFKPEQFVTHNAGIKKCYEKANHVIWQSNFDMNMSKFHWGDPKTGSVIQNGIGNSCVSKSIPMLEELRNANDKIFVCSANWHPQKRLKNNIELFHHLRDSFYPKSKLIVMGSNPDVMNSDDVLYTGSQPHHVCLEVFATANWMLHLAWLDHCPNVVVEALSVGTPVICTNQGGTHELVKGYGIVLNEKQYNFELTNYDNPPNVDVTQITKRLPEVDQLKSHANIDIFSIAEKYEKIFESVL